MRKERIGNVDLAKVQLIQAAKMYSPLMEENVGVLIRKIDSVANKSDRKTTIIYLGLD